MLGFLITAQQLALAVALGHEPEALAGKQNDKEDRTNDQRHMGKSSFGKSVCIRSCFRADEEDYTTCLTSDDRVNAFKTCHMDLCGVHITES